MDLDPLYEEEHNAAVNNVKVTKAAWCAQYHKRKSERDPQTDEEIRDRWIAAKNHLSTVRLRGPHGE